MSIARWADLQSAVGARRPEPARGVQLGECGRAAYHARERTGAAVGARRLAHIELLPHTAARKTHERAA